MQSSQAPGTSSRDNDVRLGFCAQACCVHHSPVLGLSRRAQQWAQGIPLCHARGRRLVRCSTTCSIRGLAGIPTQHCLSHSSLYITALPSRPAARDDARDEARDDDQKSIQNVRQAVTIKLHASNSQRRFRATLPRSPPARAIWALHIVTSLEARASLRFARSSWPFQPSRTSRSLGSPFAKATQTSQTSVVINSATSCACCSTTRTSLCSSLSSFVTRESRKTVTWPLRVDFATAGLPQRCRIADCASRICLVVSTGHTQGKQ